MTNPDQIELVKRIKCESLQEKKSDCRNYCICGIMAWREHSDCKFSKKSSVGDRCMYYRESINGHCDCVNAQRELKYTKKEEL
jgi:hypothetical protein